MVRELLGKETPCIIKGIPVYGNKKRALHDCNALFYVYVCNAGILPYFNWPATKSFISWPRRSRFTMVPSGPKSMICGMPRML